MRKVETADEEWRRLLAGGFAGENAPFAAHPLDARRAKRMVFVAKRAGARDIAIIDAARNYLLSQAVTSQSIAEQLLRVEKFVADFKLKSRAKCLWLTFWNSTDEPIIDSTDNLVRALDPRLSEEKIKEFIEGHYLTTYSNVEKVYFATRKKLNPYPAVASLTADHRLQAYTCGHNPWLEARLCHDVHVWEVDGVSTVSWTRDSLSKRPAS